MIFSGCQSRSREISIIDRKCPRCGQEVELISTDTEVTCEHCGFTIYNDTLSCIQWCRYARQCVGEEMYEAMKKVLEHNRRKEEAV